MRRCVGRHLGADSPTGALTETRKEIIRTWIDAGAPSVVAATETPLPSAPSAAVSKVEPPRLSFGRRLLTWIGKIHLLILHFPIALLIAAAGRETWSMVRGCRVPAPEVRYCVLLGATAAVFTVALGWLHALGGNGAGLPRVQTLHRWLGTSAGVWLVATLCVSEGDVRRGERSSIARVLILAGTVLVGLAASFGGILAQGEDYFAW